MDQEREAVTLSVPTRWRQGHTAPSKQGQEGSWSAWVPLPKGGGKMDAQRSGVRTEVKLPYLQEGLGTNSEMQLQTPALLPVEWPKLTAQLETLHLRAFLGRKRKREPRDLPFWWLFLEPKQVLNAWAQTSFAG